MARKSRFDRMFEGYERRTVYDDKGNAKTAYVYTGNYYVPVIPGGSYIWRKIIYVLLFVAAFAAEILSGIQDCAINHQKYVVTFQAAGIVCMMLFTIFLCPNIFYGKKMQVRTYKNSHEKFLIFSVISYIINGLAFLSSIVAAIINADFSTSSIITLALAIIAAGCIFGIWWLEKNTSYTIEDPDYYE